MKAILTQGPRRVSVVAGKVLALVLLMLVIVLITFGVDAIASVVIASATEAPIAWPSAGQLAKGVAAGWLIVTMWCLGGGLLGIGLRGTALGAGLGLVWALAVENLLRVFGTLVGAIDSVQKFLPGTNAGALAAALGAVPQNQPGGTPGVTAAVGGTQAAIVVASYLLAFVVAAAVLVQRRDVT
jgi:hypothetical protein